MNVHIKQISDSEYLINDALYIKAPEFQVAGIIHIGGSKTYLFALDDDLKQQLENCNQDNKYVICDTANGPAVGIVQVVTQVQEHKIIESGAYLPLKKVLRMATNGEIINEYEAFLNQQYRR